MKIQAFILPLVLCAGALGARAQTARLYTPENGLPNSQINQICQDRGGIVWICTEGGLVRFDGMAFEAFHHDRENPNAISSDSVHAFLEDSAGAHWVGTASGLDLFDADHSTFARFDLQDARRPDSNQYISQILEVPDRISGSRLFVGTGGNGVFVIDTQTRQLLDDRRGQLLALLPSEYIRTLFLDADRHLWVIPEEAGLPVILDVDTLAPAEGISVEPSLAARRTQLRITAIAEDPVSHNLLLGSSPDGLLVYESASRSLRRARGRSAAVTASSASCLAASSLRVLYFTMPAASSKISRRSCGFVDNS